MPDVGGQESECHNGAPSCETAPVPGTGADDKR